MASTKRKIILALLCSATMVFANGCEGGGSSTSGSSSEEQKTYTVTLDANGGTFESSSSSTKVISNVSTITKADLEEPSKTDYGFAGWYFDAAATSKVTFPYTLPSNMTLYAGWSAAPSGDFQYVASDGVTVELKDNTYTVTIAAEATDPSISFSGILENGKIDIEAKKYEGEFNIILNGVKITSTEALEPMFISKGFDKVKLTASEGSTNFIYDKRPSTGEFDNNGAITCKSDLTINGEGSLFVNDKTSCQGYSQAISCSKELKIKDLTLSAYGVNTAIKGSRSIDISDVKATIYSKSGTGLKTSDTDVSSKGKRRGDITIDGSSDLTIAVSKHGVNASHDVIINSSDTGTPNMNIYTNSYASSFISVVTPEIEEIDMYLEMNNDTFADQDEYRFAVKFNDADETWSNANLKKYHSTDRMNTNGRPGPGGGGVNGYYFGLDRPVSATTYQVYLFDKTCDENDAAEAVAYSNVYTLPSSGDTAKMSVSTSSITCESSFGTYDKMVEKDGNTEKASYGCKGLKADNEIKINAGTINIKAKDDAITASYGNLFPADADTSTARAVGTGNVYINGNDTKISISSADDAIHGTMVNIGDDGSPTITIDTSYEGLEAGVLNYNGGTTVLYARDDGANASGIGNIKGSNIGIFVTGGILDITIKDGDTDGIDSNNSYTQSGGLVVSRGSSGRADMSTPLDTSGTASVTGGAFLAIGSQPESNIQKGSGVKLDNSLTKGKSSGTHTIKIGSSSEYNYSFTNKSEYSGVYLYYLSSLGTPSIS